MDTIGFAWVVGLYEGEGTCYLTTNGTKGRNRGQRVPFVTIMMADEEPLIRAHEITGMGRITGPYDHPSTLSTRQFFYWRICAQDQVVAFLERAWPMLSQRRREQALPVLEWSRQRLIDRANGRIRYTQRH